MEVRKQSTLQRNAVGDLRFFCPKFLESPVTAEPAENGF